MNQAKIKWFAAYEDHLLMLVPEVRGKVDWNTAAYFYNVGTYSPEEAAAKASKTIRQGG